MGAIIVEIVDDKRYHFRQVQADKDGSFIDLGVQYSGKKQKKIKRAIETIEREVPDMIRYFNKKTISTGAFCSFDMNDSLRPIKWILEIPKN